MEARRRAGKCFSYHVQSQSSCDAQPGTCGASVWLGKPLLALCALLGWMEDAALPAAGDWPRGASSSSELSRVMSASPESETSSCLTAGAELAAGGCALAPAAGVPPQLWLIIVTSSSLSSSSDNTSARVVSTDDIREMTSLRLPVLAC